MPFYKVARNCRRPARTCRECNRRKIKCSRSTPCTNCTRSQHECVYGSTLRSAAIVRDREPQKSPGLSFDLPQDNIVSNIRPQDDHRASIVTSRSLPKSPALDLNGANERLGHNPEMTHLNEQIEGLERVFKTRAMDHASKREMYSAQPMLRDGRAVLNKTRVFGRSHWLNTAYHVCRGLLTYL